MLFKYLSGAKDEKEMKKHRINFLTFMKQFDCLLPKKPMQFPGGLDPSERNVLIAEEQRRVERLQFKLAF